VGFDSRPYHARRSLRGPRLVDPGLQTLKAGATGRRLFPFPLLVAFGNVHFLSSNSEN
jgi:hypothetical protein